MGGSMPIVVLAFGAFIAWLMLSKEGDKKVFLFYVWAAMFVIGTAHLLYLSLFH